VAIQIFQPFGDSSGNLPFEAFGSPVERPGFCRQDSGFILLHPLDTTGQLVDLSIPQRPGLPPVAIRGDV